MLELLTILVGKDIEFMLGGHYVEGRIINVNGTDRLVYIEVKSGRWIVNVDQVQMISVKE